LRRGRAYLAESSSVDLDLSAVADIRTAGPGQTLAVEPDSPVTVTATVVGAPGTRLSLITAAGRVAAVRTQGAGRHTIRWTTTGSGARFVRAEVRRTGLRLPDRMVALTNPVWLGPPGAPG
jgi:hypothetical protein